MTRLFVLSALAVALLGGTQTVHGGLMVFSANLRGFNAGQTHYRFPKRAFPTMSSRNCSSRAAENRLVAMLPLPW